jgi:hypothetical protein
MHIVQKLDEIFCRHQLCPFGLWCDFLLGFLYWLFCLDDISIGDRGVLKSPTTTVLRSVYTFKPLRVWLVNLFALTLGAYRLKIFISFWCISPFISIECPSLYHLIKVGLKFTLSNIIIATSVCFWGPLAWQIFF